MPIDDALGDLEVPEKSKEFFPLDIDIKFLKELDEKFIVSENAWRLSSAGYSSMFIMVGDEVTVENLLKGIIVAYHT